MNIRYLTIIMAIAIVFSQCVYSFEQYSQPTHNVKVQQDFADYMSNVRSKLQSNWNPPDFLEDAHVRVIFKLDNHGNIISGNIIEGSGNMLYDEAAVYAVNRSEPFGDFPENTERQTITINYSFDASMVKTDRMKDYYEKARKYTYSDRAEALRYINLAIAEVQGNENAYFLYNRRGKIKEGMGDHVGAKEDFDTFKQLKAKADLKRVHALKYRAEVEDTAFVYYYLAYAYEQINDYNSAIEAIDKAIARTDLNNQYKRYRAELISKKQ